MKIAMVFDGLGIGGIERVGIDYIKLLEDAGHTVTVYNLNPAADELEKEIGENVIIDKISFARKVCPEMYVVLIKRYWWGKYVYLPVHIVLNVVLTGYKLLKKKRKEKYDFAIAFSGHFNDLTFVAKEFVNSENKIAWIHGGILDYALLSSGFLMLYKKIHNIVSLSSFYENGVLNVNRYLRDINIKKIYNPTFIGKRKLNVEIVNELKSKYGEFFLMVGRFTKEKDHCTVIKAMELLKAEYRIERKILFVGDGPERERVEKIVCEKGLKEQIIFMGNRYDVQNYYAASSILIHSSPAEGLPTVILEAMHFGIPVVATNSLPGVPEILEGTQDGLVCPVGDAEKMAEYLYDLITQPELYKKYSQRGKKRIKDFEPENIQKELLEFLYRIKDNKS